MARPSNEQITKSWLEKISAAKKKHKEFKDTFRVDKARAYFEGRQNEGASPSEWITVNKVYSNLMAQLPTLYSVDPYFYVKLKKFYHPDPMMIAMYEQRGKIRQANLNYYKEELDLKTKARLGILDAEFAYGVIKVHYKADEVENPDKGKPMMSEDGETQLVDESGGPLMEPDYIPVNERYCITRIHPDDFIWDEDSGPLEDKWGFVAERVKLTKEEARKDRRLNQRLLKQVGTVNKKKDEDPPNLEESNKNDEIYILWEIYDLKKKQWLIVAENQDDKYMGPIMTARPLPKYIENHPYAILRFTLRDNSPYPIPPVSQVIDPQKEYNSARSKVQTHRKRFNRKYEVFVGGLTDEEDSLSALESGDDGTIIKKQTAARVVDPISDAPLDPQLYSEIALLNGDIVEMFGTNAEGLRKVDSATEASILDKRSDVKEGDRLSLVIDWIKTIARKLDMCIQAHISEDQAIRISGPEGDFWQIVRTEDYEAIKGEFEYSVNVGSTMPRLPEIERSQWMAFLQVLASFPHLLAQPRFMKHMAELHHIEDEAMLEELNQLGKQILGGQVPMPGGGGSQPGAENNPITAILGKALGMQGGVVNQASTGGQNAVQM